MKTAVEWLVDEYFGGIENCTPDFRFHIQQAKEMEKEQIENAYQDGWMSCEKWFADKELDDHIADTNETFKSEK